MVIKVDCSGEYTPGKKYEVGNPQRFGQDFIKRVANPNDIVQFHSKKASVRTLCLVGPAPHLLALMF